MKKLTQNEFLDQSRQKHGDKYNYDKAIYTTGRNKIIITCLKHGDFLQTAKLHLQGSGCPKCAGNCQLTTEDFITKAKEVHSNKFDYSKTIYQNSNTKVIIICPIHGEFEQIPYDHLNGCGCNQCRLSKSITNEYVPNKARLREYKIWKGIKTRTTNPNTSDAERYLNRNILCCERWLKSFEDFYADMGPCPDKYSIDRINNDLGYFPENCRWASSSEQAKNRGSFNLLFTHNEKTQVLKDWAKEFNINYTTLYTRIMRSGLTFEEAIQQDPYQRLIEINGELKILKEWCKIYNIKYQTVINRIHKHKWSIEEAILTPYGQRKSNKNKI